MKIEEIFTTYWSQITLLLLGVGYLIKAWIDARNKRKEINHNLYQERKLNSLNTFFLVYSKNHQAWQDLVFELALSNGFSAKELDEKLTVPLNELKRSVLELQIYSDKNLQQHFKSIYQSFYLINVELQNEFKQSPGERGLSVMKLILLRRQALEANELAVEEICKAVRKQFQES